MPTYTADTNSIAHLHYYLPHHLFVCFLFIPPPLFVALRICQPSLFINLASPTLHLCNPFIPKRGSFFPSLFPILLFPVISTCPSLSVCLSGSVFHPGGGAGECSVTLIDHIRCPLSVSVFGSDWFHQRIFLVAALHHKLACHCSVKGLNSFLRLSAFSYRTRSRKKHVWWCPAVFHLIAQIRKLPLAPVHCPLSAPSLHLASAGAAQSLYKQVGIALERARY